LLVFHHLNDERATAMSTTQPHFFSAGTSKLAYAQAFTGPVRQQRTRRQLSRLIRRASRTS
jgi:hypothetical protein